MTTPNQIQIQIQAQVGGDAAVQTVSARDLHESLEVGKDFSNWVKAQISRARLVEDRDFVKLAQKGELSATGQTTVEYFFTVDSAKHVAMMSNTEKGFEVREYFIAVEREFKKRQNLTPHLTTPIFYELKREAARADRVGIRWMCKNTLPGVIDKHFSDVSPTVRAGIIKATQTHFSSFFPDEDGNLTRLAPKDAYPTFIESGWTDKEIEQHHARIYKDVPNPPETLEEMRWRLGSRPKGFLLDKPPLQLRPIQETRRLLIEKENTK